MSPEILVMCPSCGQPQVARGGECVGCGAALALPEEAKPRSTRQQLLDAYSPEMECDLGSGRRILFSAKRLEWRPRSGRPLVIEHAQLESATLQRRLAWESLLLGVPALAVLTWAPNWLRLVLVAFLLLALVACFLQRRYDLILKLSNGEVRSLYLGIGTSRAPVVERIVSVWSSLSDALRAVGVKTVG